MNSKGPALPGGAFSHCKVESRYLARQLSPDNLLMSTSGEDAEGIIVPMRPPVTRSLRTSRGRTYAFKKSTAIAEGRR